MSKSWLSISIGLALAASSIPPALAQAQSGATPRQSQPAWATRCLASERGAALTCVMEERVLNQSGQVIAAVLIRVAGNDPEPVLTMQLPLGIDLAAGVRLRIDQGEEQAVAVRTCESSGCYAEITLPAELLTRLKAGQTLTMGLKPMESDAVSLPFTLQGFTAAYNRIAAPGAAGQGAAEPAPPAQPAAPAEPTAPAEATTPAPGG